MELAKPLAECPLPIRWIIADDGSSVDDHQKLENLRQEFAKIFPHVEIHFAAHHHGKGSVVREAWALRPDAEWLAFVDADGSVSAGEMLGLIQKAVDADSSVLGIRKRTATTRVVESAWRGFLHRGFLIAAHVILGVQSEDLQCGAKVLRGSDYRRVAGELREAGLAFDSELLCALIIHGATWLEIPVNWIEKPGGKVRPLRDAWAMFLSLLRIRRRMG
jgi:glycosyltransferase involved in cell wall biosynthesis